jgi:hypothetical protein
MSVSVCQCHESVRILRLIVEGSVPCRERCEVIPSLHDSHLRARSETLDSGAKPTNEICNRRPRSCGKRCVCQDDDQRPTRVVVESAETGHHSGEIQELFIQAPRVYRLS